jgi:hypothetical protein
MDNGGEDLPAPLKQTQYDYFPKCTYTSPSRTSPFEATVIRFDLNTQPGIGKFACNETTKTHAKVGFDVAMDAHDVGGRPDSRSANKHPQQTHVLVWVESTSSCIHLIIISPLLT